MTARVQRINSNEGDISWVVVDSSGEIVEPISHYLSHLRNLERSPNTIKSYSYSLAEFWCFLDSSQLYWKSIKFEHLANFMGFLMEPRLNSHEEFSIRSERTVNHAISAVSGFIDFQSRLGNIDNVDCYRKQTLLGKKYKPFLHHITKRKPTKLKVLKIKEPKDIPQTLTDSQIASILDACQHLRDKFLVSLLFETGMRIGQALGLKHCDIETWNNKIFVVPRKDNKNGVRAKTLETYPIHVSTSLMEMYSLYLVEEYPESATTDHVFVNIWKNPSGCPMTYSGSRTLLDTLKRRTGIDFRWHMFRHSHATDLIRHKWNPAFVQKRLGHQSIQTTSDIYSHLDDGDMREAFDEYWESRNDSSKSQ